jgi:outer membrane protein assembly factor BamB
MASIGSTLALIIVSPILPGRTAAAPAVQAVWTQNHLDAAHDGFNRFETILSPSTVGGLGKEWIGRAPLSQMINPVVTESAVYVAGAATGFTGDTWLVAFDRSTGSTLWRAQQPNANTVAGLAELRGRVFLSTVDDHLLRAYDESSGVLLWSFHANGGLSTPTIAFGRVFVNSNFGQLYALDPATGLPIWTTGMQGGANGGPAVAGGRVFTTNGNGSSVGAFDARTGAAQWTTTLDANDNGSPTAAAGMVFVGTIGHSVYALDQVTGDVVWHITTTAGVESTPAVANGIVYVGDDGGDLYALRESDGTQLWTAHTDRQFVLSSPIVANGVVYAATQGSYAFDALTGALLWQHPTTGIVNADPAVVDGMLYVPDFAGKLRAYALQVTGA